MLSHVAMGMETSHMTRKGRSHIVLKHVEGFGIEWREEGVMNVTRLSCSALSLDLKEVLHSDHQHHCLGLVNVRNNIAMTHKLC